LYSRIKNKLGRESLIPNQGVAQGSVISPALFNIYSEGLLHKLQEELHINLEDLLSYADDTLIICDSPYEVRNVIQTIKSWSAENNLKLNEKKSGIVEFLHRKSKPCLKIDSIDGFPVCKEYRYLGLKLSNKLYMKDQLAFIWWKAKEIQRQLYPFLSSADLDTRKSMWQTFIQPLIEFILPLYKWESAKCHRDKADSIIRGTFKLFTGLNSKTSNEIVDLLSGYNFKLRAQLIYIVSQNKWNCRKRGETFSFDSLPSYMKRALNPDKFNLCRRMPKELVTYLNTTRSLCPLCKVPNTLNHLELVHKYFFPGLKTVLQSTRKLQKAKIPRNESLKAVNEILNPLLQRLRNCISHLTSLSLLL
jgi:hypothetical protein